MRLKQLQLENFRRFDGVTFDFSQGLNVVVGPNEHGKSTIVHAIVAGLFYDPLKKPSRDVLRHQRWNYDGLYTIRMIFDAEDGEYTLVKDFQNHELLLRGPAGKKWKTFPEVSKEISRLTGLSTPTLFESSACIYQDRVSEIHATKSELARVLQELVTSEKQDVNVLTLLRALSREVMALKKGLDRTVSDPGQLRTVRDTLEAAEEQYATLQKAASEVSRLQSEQQGMLVLQKQAKDRYDVVTDLLAVNTKRRATLDALESARSVFAELDEAKDAQYTLERELEEQETRQKSYQPFLQKNAEEKIQHCIELRAMLAAEKKSVAQKTVPQSFAPSPMVRYVYMVLATLSAALGMVGFFAHTWFFVFFLGAVIFGALGVVEFLKRRKEVVEVSGRERAAVEDIAQYEKQLKDVFREFGVDSYEALQQKHENFQKYEQRARETRARLQELRRVYNPQEMTKQRMESAARVMALEQELQSLPTGKGLSPEQLVVLEKEASELQEKLSRYEDALRRGEAIIEHTNIQEGEMTELAERISELKSEYTQLTNRLFIYEKIGTTLKAAQLSTMSSVRETLQTFIQAHLPKITSGRYDEVQVGTNLEIFVKSREHGDFVDPRENMSRGTIDQIYLMARFALAFSQADGKYPPFLLDDPFVTFDAERKRETTKLLKEFSRDFQIFLFTYSDEYNSFADTVIPL